MQTTTDARIPTLRERDAIDRLRVTRIVHGNTVTDRRYQPPELQPAIARQLGRMRGEVRALVSIIRRERRLHPGPIPNWDTLRHAISGFDPSGVVEWISSSPELTAEQIHNGVGLFYDENDD